MKTDEQLVEMALKIAESDKNATVMVALPSYMQARRLFGVAVDQGRSLDVIFKSHSMTAEFPAGGRVIFAGITEDTLMEWGGCQYSHAFDPAGLPYRCSDLVKSKIRVSSAKPLTGELSGYYTPFYVERRIKYDN